MSKVNKDNLGFLGLDYEVRLIAQFLTDKKFANNIMDIIDPNHFSDEKLKLIVRELKDAHETHQTILDMVALKSRLNANIDNLFTRDFVETQLDIISKADLNDTYWVQETAMKFCKQQALKKSLNMMQQIVDKGDLNTYDDCEDILKKALMIGENKDDSVNVFDNPADVLADDFRKPIPTGIKGFDELMNGGLARTELAIILAPFGVGKTTMITKIANSAKDLHYNVIQIFFEDNIKVIQRKHFACWSGYELNDLSNHREELIEMVKNKEREPGKLILKKFPSDGTTIPKIRAYIRKQISMGFKPDLVLIDYIDCIEPSRKFDDVNAGEGNVMRQFETMLSELDIAGWTAVQGNRSSIKAEVVESDQMGGSIKKGQIGHFLVSVARSNEQKESGHANLAILKSRFGKDGIVLNDCIFDNGRVQIEVTDQDGGRTFLQTKQDKSASDTLRVINALNKAKVQKENNNNSNESNESS